MENPAVILARSVEFGEIIPLARGGRSRLLREALAGSHRDFTSFQLRTAIFLLAVPMVIEMAMDSLFGVVDIFFVARLGHNAVTTVGLTESILALVFGVALGLSMATTAMVARRIGEKDSEGAAVAAVQAVGIGLIVSAVVGVIGLPRAPPPFPHGCIARCHRNRPPLHGNSARNLGRHFPAVPRSTPSSAARAMQRSRCAPSGSQTESISSWTLA